MTEYTQKAFKIDKDLPLTCATFAGYFLSRKSLANVDSLAHKAIQYTDVDAVASDGWYLLARKEHLSGEPDRAADYYPPLRRRARRQRPRLPAGQVRRRPAVGGQERPGEAKLRLEKMIQQSKNHEAMVLLGTLYAEEVFAAAAAKEDKTAEAKKAVSLLESVRAAWKDAKKNFSPDAAVLLNLARLYEMDHPDKALQCLQQVEQLEMDQIPDSDRAAVAAAAAAAADAAADKEGDADTAADAAADKEAAEAATTRAGLRKLLPPQLLNNMGCFYWQAEKYEAASDMFEAALGACMRIQEKDQEMDTDALVTTLSFNLGRSYEARGMTDQAVEVYEAC